MDPDKIRPYAHMGSFRAIFQVLLVALVVLSTGCAIGTRTLKERSGISLSPEQRLSFVQKLNQRAEEVDSFRALSTSRIAHEDTVETFRQVFLLQRPGQLRMEILPMQTFYTLGMVIVNDGSLMVVDSETKEVTLEQVSPRTVGAAIGIPLKVEELFSILTARVPRSIFTETGDLPLDTELYEIEGSYLLKSREGTFLALCNKESALIESIELRDQFNDSLLVTASYAQPEEITASDGIRIPVFEKVLVEVSRSEVQAELSLSNITINKPVDPVRFALLPPAGYKVVNRSSSR